MYEKDDPEGFVHGYAPGMELGRIATFDDYIGRHRVEYSLEELTALQVGQSKVEGSLVSGGADGVYEFTWRITRLPDAQPVVGPVTRLHEPNPQK
jgi:hypothetical protein